ncbi:MAG: M24 family metallopeptidase [Rhodospirillaceae bacterium]|nr:M24 family metallopeptidase [Rhodospirillaceae bacterium]
MDRRSLLANSAIGSLAAALHSGSAAAAPIPGIPPANPSGKILANKPRAFDVMARYGIDGLVAANPLNVYYLTNTITLGTKFRGDFGGFATLARDPSQPSFLICTTAETWDIANRDRELPEVIYTSGARAGQALDKGVEPEPVRPRNYAHRTDVSLTDREQAWVAAQQAANDAVAPGAAWGIARALKQSGLAKGRLAVDDMRIKYMLEEIGFEGPTFVPGEDVFKLIRMVKTAPEIEIMRTTGANNAAAAEAAMRAMEPGMTFADFQNLFRAACGERGSDMMSIICGMPGGMMPDPVAVKGKPYIVDAVSSFGMYAGDYARTLVLGDPPKDVLARARANRIARDTVFEMVKPGVKFAALREAGVNAMVKAGIPDYAVFVTPHCVGLSHSDQPFRLAGIDPTPFDHALEENMVLTIDLPYLEVGWGGGHCEDLFRVTRTGLEPLNPVTDPLVVV